MSGSAPAIGGISSICVDTPDPPRLATFWGALLGAEPEPDEGGDVRLSPPGGPYLDFLRVGDERVTKNRVHIDLRSSDLAAAVEQAVALGASRADDVFEGEGWQVMRDPEGNEFCILGPEWS